MNYYITAKNLEEKRRILETLLIWGARFTSGSTVDSLTHDHSCMKWPHIHLDSDNLITCHSVEAVLGAKKCIISELIIILQERLSKPPVIFKEKGHEITVFHDGSVKYSCTMVEKEVVDKIIEIRSELMKNG